MLPPTSRPFCLTHAIARVGTRADQTARTICRTRESSSSRLLGLFAYEVKPTTALTLLESEDSAGTIDELFNSYLACFSVLG